MHYLCLECGEEFDLDEARQRIERVESEFWGEKSTIKRYIDLCPHCESDLLEEKGPACKCCGSNPPERNSQYCEDCLIGIEEEAYE